MGGTFVDCAVTVGEEIVAVGKAPTTPADPAVGIVDAIAAAADELGLRRDALMAAAERLVHGTTVGLNTLITRSGGEVGLLATRGHEDAILIGRVHQKVAGLAPEELIRVAELAKPEPLVPRWRIHGIHERVDARGRVLARLDEDGVADAVAALVSDGCDALAIAFLWSFRHPAHERRASAIARRVRRNLRVSISSDVAPVLGEYERTAATVVNAYLGRSAGRYVRRLRSLLARAGFRGSFGVLTSDGVLVDWPGAATRPVETLRSGPVGGVLAAAAAASRLGRPDVLATDVGGTSFDVAVIRDGRPERADVTIAARYHLAVPSVEVASIGAGGGSIAWLDADCGVHVGPRSAGALPGPACYDRGGTEATVTDADVVLGRLSPAGLLGGRIRIDAGLARGAVAALARQVGLDEAAMAAGIVRVVDAHMADLVRRVTVERGHDPRDLLLVAYGGAAGLHAAAYGFDAGATEVVLPVGAGVFSARGLAAAERGRGYVRPGPLVAPFPLREVRAAYAAMERWARADFRGVELVLRREIDLRYRRQTHRLRIPVAGSRIERETLDEAIASFEREYERVYGREAGYAGAGVEAVAFRLAARPIRPPDVGGLALPDRGRPPARRRARVAGRRAVYFDGWIEATPIVDAPSTRRGDVIEGPAVAEWPTTTLLVPPGFEASIDERGNAHLVRAR